LRSAVVRAGGHEHTLPWGNDEAANDPRLAASLEYIREKHNYLVLKPFNLPEFVINPKAILSEDDIILIQDQFLKENLGLERSDLICYPVMDQHPEYDSEAEGRFDMYTSGTSLNKPRKYVYPWLTHAQIETYHMNRIMHFNDLEPGHVLQITPQTKTQHKEDPLSGPFIDMSMGLNNTVWKLKHPIRPTKDFWLSAFEDIRRLKPKFVVCRPSEIQSFLEFPVGQLECPAITTCETLLPHVRKAALEIFPWVIDKMRCWDGGLSFFECRHGTRHVNEELSIVETVADRVVSTDIFNWLQRFVRYDNGDRCATSRKKCHCGISGLVFDTFDGKRMEALVTPRGHVISSGNLMNRVIRKSSLKKGLADFTFQFQIVQQPDGSADIYIDRDVPEETRLGFGALISYMLNDDGNSSEFAVRTTCRPRTSWNKQLLVKSFYGKKNNAPVF
jgi:hypothetical protein